MEFERAFEEEEIGFQMAPMIDVVFLLLIFFMCVTTFYRLETEITISLPKAEAAEKAVKLPGELIINVTEEGKIVVNQKIVEMEQLKNLLGEAKRNKSSVTIRGDEDARHGRVMDILDVCAEAGVNDVSFRTVEKNKD